MTTPFHHVHHRDLLAELDRRTKAAEQRARLLASLPAKPSARTRLAAGRGVRSVVPRWLVMRLRRRRALSVGAQLCLEPAR